MKMNRRQFMQTAATLFCAPAIVKAENIMKIAAPKIETLGSVDVWVSDFHTVDMVPDKHKDFFEIYSGGQVVAIPRKQLQMRTPEEALEAALKQAWERGYTIDQARLNPSVLAKFQEQYDIQRMARRFKV